MRAIFLNKKAGADALESGEVPEPAPKEGEILVNVHATAIMPAELGWFPTFNTRSGQPRSFPIVLSHEFSGVVKLLGPGVSSFDLGQPVYGLNDWFDNGAQAECCVVPAAALAIKPKSLDHPRAAVVPISALTAWQGLFERTSLDQGQRVLIHGGAGAVGAFAVQLV